MDPRDKSIVSLQPRGNQSESQKAMALFCYTSHDAVMWWHSARNSSNFTRIQERKLRTFTKSFSYESPIDHKSGYLPVSVKLVQIWNCYNTLRLSDVNLCSRMPDGRADRLRQPQWWVEKHTCMRTSSYVQYRIYDILYNI